MHHATAWAKGVPSMQAVRSRDAEHHPGQVLADVPGNPDKVARSDRCRWNLRGGSWCLLTNYDCTYSCTYSHFRALKGLISGL